MLKGGEPISQLTLHQPVYTVLADRPHFVLERQPHDHCGDRFRFRLSYLTELEAAPASSLLGCKQLTSALASEVSVNHVGFSIYCRVRLITRPRTPPGHASILLSTPSILFRALKFKILKTGISAVSYGDAGRLSQPRSPTLPKQVLKTG